jgi:hypothetical protein
MRLANGNDPGSRCEAGAKEPWLFDFVREDKRWSIMGVSFIRMRRVSHVVREIKIHLRF